ncbi:YlmC/YmxH family sporulation protein [Ammonifex thiophilus]|uniref:YlmC/YmxH family sporulation protein n=1 Tax=Ammonifex thiophilus TaxID=444093 RepID=A0A3D8P5Y8_9THEO|nr:YlmC/YmxH family sporulation protein [Ammonifex thiophilus]RDV84736.1 YlmC/YmxH family sporulation protein [Ammonifex thiophilus]
MFKVSELTRRQFINVLNGRRLGAIKDVHVDEKGMITAVVLHSGKRFLGIFPWGKDVVIPWSQVKKIGVDAVLVEAEEA